MPKPYTKAVVAASRSEVELLLCCACTCMDAEKAERIRTLLQKDIDWVYLSGTALVHGVMPLLYWSLHTSCPELVPKAILDPLGEHFHTNAARNLFLTVELLKLLHLLEAHEIPAIPYKGPVLAASAYSNLALREFYDLDILVHKRHILRAKDLFVSQGYRPSIPLTGAQEAAYVESYHEYTLVRDDGAVVVELQWAVTKSYFSFPLDFEPLWERRQAVSLAGKTVCNLSPEDLLLILCVHGSKHLWNRLGWICDLAELIRMRQEMDWGRLFERASTLGGQRMLLLGLSLTKDLLGTALPEEALQRMQADTRVKSLAAHVRARLFTDAHSPSGLLHARPLLYCMMKERFWDKVQLSFYYCRLYLRMVITPSPTDRAFLLLPPILSFLYYPLRPLRVIGQYGTDFCKTLSSRLTSRRMSMTPEDGRGAAETGQQPADADPRRCAP